MKTLLKKFYWQSGATNYLPLMMIPSTERLPALAKADRPYIHKLISAQIEYCMKFFNLSNGLSLEQIFLLSDEIIDDSETDNLSLQDVFVFLQKLAAGKMGTVFNRLDIPTFRELFEIHRQERYEEMLEIRYGQQVNHKAQGPTERASDNQDREKELMHGAMKDYLKDKFKPI